MPARGGRVAHNKRKGKRKAGTNVGATTEQPGAKQAGDGAEFKLVGAAAVAYGEGEQEYSTKLAWAACLRRAFFFDANACPCGGRRQLIAVILQASEVEKILRHLAVGGKAATRMTATSSRSEAHRATSCRRKTSPTTIGTAGMNRRRSIGRLEESRPVANCAGHSARGQKRNLALGGPRAFNTRKYERF